VFEELLTEQRNPASEGIDRMPVEEMLRIMNAEDRRVAEAVGREIPRIAQAVEAVAGRLSRGGRLFYIGAGTSGRLGVLDASECPPTFSVPAELVQGIIAGGESALMHATEASEDDPEAGARDLAERGFTAADALVGIAASGQTPYVLGAVKKAREAGALTIGISCVPDSELSRAVEIAIEPVTGPEVIAGSTRMKAGTATKLVLNMLSTATMIRLGHVYGNLMVDVQQTNAKLADRARRIVAEAAAVSAEAAADCLERSGGAVKTAIVMARTGLGREEAEARLRAAGGRVAEALEEESNG
jgi:N-acetylmuramic acid 6-phosphate etherase